jgi:PAS domain S-box-containing protein
VRGLADGVLVCDRDGRIVDVNPAFFRGLGVVGPAPIGKPAARVLAPWPLLATAVTGGRARGELAVDATNGPRWFDVRTTKLRDGQGNDLGCVLVLRDVSDSKRASERRFRAVFDHAFELIGLLDEQGTLLAANSTALEFAGVTSKQVVGRPFWETPWWAHSATLREELRDAIHAVRSGEVARFETTHLRCDSKSRYFDFSLKAVRDDGGAIEFMIAEGRDMTELRQAERENATLTERLEKARRLESVGRLAGGIAHDFNNLLQAIIGSIDIARTQLGAAVPAEKPLAIAAQAADSAARLTRQLLAFGRRHAAEPRLVDVGEALRRLTPLLRALVAPRVRLDVHVSPGAWPIRIDPAHLEQVLMNLIINARDAMADGGRLLVEAQNLHLLETRTFQAMEAPPGEYLQLRVADSGAGMSESVVERMFEPFFSTKPTGKGTGLGLSVVYGIVQQSGGYLEVSSHPGTGTEIRLLFPRGEHAAVEAAPGALPAPGTLPGGRERILVVEDQQAVRGFMRDLLQGLGYEVHAYADGRSAQSAASALKGAPDLLLADVVLPGLSGPEVADALRGRWPGLKVLLVSGISDDGAPWRASRAGAFFLPKPVGASTLARRVRAILDTPTPAE